MWGEVGGIQQRQAGKKAQKKQKEHSGKSIVHGIKCCREVRRRKLRTGFDNHVIHDPGVAVASWEEEPIVMGQGY